MVSYRSPAPIMWASLYFELISVPPEFPNSLSARLKWNEMKWSSSRYTSHSNEVNDTPVIVCFWHGRDFWNILNGRKLHYSSVCLFSLIKTEEDLQGVGKIIFPLLVCVIFEVLSLRNFNRMLIFNICIWHEIFRILRLNLLCKKSNVRSNPRPTYLRSPLRWLDLKLIQLQYSLSLLFFRLDNPVTHILLIWLD